MDWENKFSAMVRETECSLARVKQRLGAARTSSVNSLNLSGYSSSHSRDSALDSFHSSYTASPYLPTSTLQPGLGDSKISSSSAPVYGSVSNEKDEPLPLASSPGVINYLQGKLEAHDKVIEDLTRNVKRLQQEKDFYYKQVKDLREEISILNSRIQERGVDLNTEHKIDSWKRDVMSEISMLHTQMTLSKTGGEEASNAGSQVAALIREVKDFKRYIEDEMTMLRRDIDTLKSKSMKVERENSMMNTDYRDLSRKHEKLDRYVQDLKDTQNSSSRDLSRAMDEHESSRMDVAELKSSLRSLRSKLSTVEEQMYESTRNGPTRRILTPEVSGHQIHDRRIMHSRDSEQRKHHRMKKKISTSTIKSSPPTSDLDISDSTDLGDFSLSTDVGLTPRTDNGFTPRAKYSKGFNVGSGHGADDLDLDDLDLSDDLSSAGTMTAEDL